MTELRVHDVSISLDGYGAGPRQSMDEPLGEGAEQLHEWMFAADAPEVDRRFRNRGTEGFDATIMERGPPSPHRSRRAPEGGLGGRRPSHDVVVLCHHLPDPVPMAGGTTFHFVTAGIAAALERARAVAGGRAIRLGSGVATVQEYLRAGLVDELHLVVVPVLLHRGERLFEDLDAALEGWSCVEFAPSRAVTHVRLRRA